MSLLFKEFESNDSTKHIGCFDEDGIMIAFCCLVARDNYWAMGNTWCEKTIRGKRAFALGIDWILERYLIGFTEEGKNHTNKVRRYCENKLEP